MLQFLSSYSYYYESSGNPVVSTITTIISLIATAVALICMWKIFVKMDMPGWYAVIPMFNTWKLFEKIFGQGWYMFLMLVPLLNIYVAIKLYCCLGQGFGKGAGFGFLMIFFSIIALPILAFGEDEWDEDYEASMF